MFDPLQGRGGKEAAPFRGFHPRLFVFFPFGETFGTIVSSTDCYSLKTALRTLKQAIVDLHDLLGVVLDREMRFHMGSGGAPHLLT